MSMDYVEKRVKEALKLSKGNALKARKQLMAWTYEDVKLLHALTQNHLSGIVAYHIDRVKSGRSDKAKIPPLMSKKAAASKKPESFGMEILKAVVNSGELFGLETPGMTRKRGQASQRHINAINQMASKSKPKKK